MHVNFRVVDGSSSRAVVIAGVVVVRFPASESELPKTGVVYDKFVDEGNRYPGPDRFDDCWHYKEQQKNYWVSEMLPSWFFQPKATALPPDW